MKNLSWKSWLATGLVLVCAAFVVYLLIPQTENVITSEREAKTSCEVALKSHLRDMKQENEAWAITTVQFDSSVGRWLCTLTGAKGKLYIILKPKTGGFEVSTSSN